MLPSDSIPAAKDAATVIVLREEAGALQALLLKRAGSGFLSGVHVFAGGKVEDQDRVVAQSERIEIPALSDVQLQALGCTNADEAKIFYSAALRETYEETGIALRAQSLIPCARWITPVVETKRFDARFFLASLPENQIAVADGSEAEQIDWVAPGTAFDAVRDGTIRLAPPTLLMLDWLAQYSTLDAALKSFSNRILPVIQPEILARDEGWFLAFPGDEAHSIKERALPGPTRLFMDEQKRWMPAP